MKFNIFILTGFLFLASCGDSKKSTPEGSDQAINTPPTEAEQAEWIAANIDSILSRRTFDATNGMKMPYRFFEPKKKDEGKYPLLVFLHGRGQRGTDNGPALYNNVGIFVGAQSLLKPDMQEKYPCFILIPQCSDKTINEEWAKWVGNTPETPFEGLGKDGSYQQAEQPSESGAAALELIDSTIANYGIDESRIYIIGKSMGGFGTWEFTARRPELFAAAVPMAGYSDTSKVDEIKHIPFWIFHGGADDVNPVQGSRTMFDLLTKADAEVKYTEYEGADHGGAFQKAFDEQELIPWIFSHKKPN